MRLKTHPEIVHSCLDCHAIRTQAVWVARQAIRDREAERAGLGELKPQIVMNPFVHLSPEVAALTAQQYLPATGWSC